MSTRIISLTLTVAFVVLTSSVVRAEEGDAVEASRQEARGLFQRGLELVDQERWEDALEAFDASLSLYPTQTALYNRALCNGLAGRPAEAVVDLEAHLEQYRETVDGERLEAVEAELERQRRRIGRIAIRVDGADAAEVSVDGVAVGRTPLAEALAVNPGRHQVTVSAEGFEPISRWVTVGGGDETALVLAMVQAGDAPSAPPGAVTPPATTERPGRGLTIGGIVLGGAALATLATALSFNLRNNDRHAQWSDADGYIRDDLTDPPVEFNSDYVLYLQEDIDVNNALASKIEEIDRVSLVLLGVGSAAAVASAVLIILGSRRRSESNVSLLPTTGGLMLTGAF